MFSPHSEFTTAASILLVVAVLLSGCEKSPATAPAESTPTDMLSDHDDAQTVSTKEVSAPELVSLTDLPDRIRSHQGKLVFVDLWALW